MNDQATTLESRIASALVATDITSTDLSQLLVEVEAAAAAADADATVNVACPLLEPRVPVSSLM